MSFNDGRWAIHYGCDEWSQTDYFHDEGEARQRFIEICADPVNMGAYPMTFATLEDPEGITADAWDEEWDEDWDHEA